MFHKHISVYIQELQDLLEVHEEQEKEFMEREQKFLKRLEQGKCSDKLVHILAN